MSKETLKKILAVLSSNNISYRHLQHDTIPTHSAGASQLRGTTHEHGAKALILITKSKQYIQVVLPANKRVSLKKVKNIIGEKNVSLAHPNMVKEKTDCIIGSVPPFSSLWNMNMYIDKSLLEIDEVVFSAGTLEDSIFIAPVNLAKINDARIVDMIQEV